MVMHARSGGNLEVMGLLLGKVDGNTMIVMDGVALPVEGIDVSTQMLNQQFQEPFVAIVLDPVRTISAGKVNIGAFRTYPKGYKPPDEAPSEYQSIPLNKIEDFGCTLQTNADYTTGQIFDLADKLEQSEGQLGRGGFMLGMDTQEKKSEDKLAKAARHGSCKTTMEVIHGLMSQVIKDRLFNQVHCKT
nr:hypothetical protein BaRGS_023272 [Batillaria attramentaria]